MKSFIQYYTSTFDNEEDLYTKQSKHVQPEQNAKDLERLKFEFLSLNLKQFKDQRPKVKIKL